MPIQRTDPPCHVVPAPSSLQVALMVLASSIGAASAETAPAGTSSVVSAGSGVQVMVSLAFVLALVVAVAWLLKRFSGFRAPGSGLIRVVAGVAVGQRERIVLVEVDGTWLLVGVAPGQVRTLHTMPKAQAAMASELSTPAPALTGFSSWLSQITQRRSRE